MPKTAHLTTKLVLWTLLVAAPVCFAQEADEPLQWAMVGGKPFAAEYVRTTENGVVLRQPGTGRESEIPFSKLDIKSHFQAKKLGNPEAYNKPLVKAEVKPELPEVELATVTPEELASPFPADPTIEQFLSTLKTSNQSMDLVKMLAANWHSLPPRMQEDVESLVEKTADKLGPATIAQIRKLMESVGTIVQEKSDFVFNNPHVTRAQIAGQVKPFWPQISGLVGAITMETHWQDENFKKGNMIPALATMLKTAEPFGVELYEKLKPMIPPDVTAALAFDYKILSQSKERAEIEVTAGPQPTKLAFQKVGKIWVVPSSMNDARKGLDQANAAIDNLAPAKLSGATFALTGVNAIAGQLAAAESQEDFDALVEQLLQMAKGLRDQFAPPQ